MTMSGKAFHLRVWCRILTLPCHLWAWPGDPGKHKVFFYPGLCATLTHSLRSGPPVGVAFGTRFCGNVNECRTCHLRTWPENPENIRTSVPNGLCAALTHSLRSGLPVGVAFGTRFRGNAQIKGIDGQFLCAAILLIENKNNPLSAIWNLGKIELFWF